MQVEKPKFILDDSHLLVDPHSHSNFGGDDGVNSPEQMFQAGLEAGVLIIPTPHNTAAPNWLYREEMRSRRLEGLAIAGIEWGFSRSIVTAQEAIARSRETTTLYICAGPDTQYFAGGARLFGWERMAMVSAKEVEAAQGLIASSLEQLFNKPVAEILGGTAEALAEMEEIELHQAPSALDLRSRYIAQGVYVALTDPDFPLVLAIDRKNADTREQIPGLSPEEAEAARWMANLPEGLQIAILAHEYQEIRRQIPEKSRLMKGEIITLFPAEPSLLKKMEVIANFWKTHGYHKTMPLVSLLDIFADKLTEGERRALVLYVPHLISLNYSFWGGFLVRTLERVDELFPIEVLVPEIAEQIGVVEIFNGNHPGGANQTSAKVAQKLELLAGRGTTGASDSHGIETIGSGATLVKVDQMSAEGIIAALQQAESTLPISGMGKRSLGWRPLFSLATTVWGQHLPHFVRGAVVGKLDIITPAKRVLEEGIIYTRENNPEFRNSGWIY